MEIGLNEVMHDKSTVSSGTTTTTIIFIIFIGQKKLLDNTDCLREIMS